MWPLHFLDLPVKWELASPQDQPETQSSLLQTHPTASAVARLDHILGHLVALVEANGHWVADRHGWGKKD